MKCNLGKKLGTMLLLCMMLLAAGCGKGNDSSNITFTQVKTSGVVKAVSPDKVIMTVTEDDLNFKKDDQVVVTFKNIYLSKSQSKSDVLVKTNELSTGDEIYVIYSEEQKKDNVINVADVVKEGPEKE